VCEVPCYTVFTVDKEVNEMNTREHMENLAIRYADALVRYHLDKNPSNFDDMAALHDMLNMVCVEVAEEEEV